MKRYILAIDQGTSSSRCVIYDRQARPVAFAQQEFAQLFPHPGWAEHDAEEIWRTQCGVCRKAMAQLQLEPADIAAIGITNQRETTVVWNRYTGKPIHNAIVWHDRRTAEQCVGLYNAGCDATVRAKTGLLIDAYFSATKIRWILDHVDGARQQAERGELAFGTIDSWLLWKLTDGVLHVTDVTNASRTMLFNIERMQWDDELLSMFDIPAAMLPTVKPTVSCFGETKNKVFGEGIPIAAVAGDQHAALFGQQCTERGMAKCTYGTGSFLMMNTGRKRVISQNSLLTTIAWQIDDEPVYALEGSVFVSGAAIQWLRDGLKFFGQAADSETLAADVADNGGVVFVPALTGLGAPHWDPQARGAIFGITRGTTQAHITRAALESIGFQVNDLLHAMSTDTGYPISELRIDGGAVANDLLVQFQADISGIDVVRPVDLETTALGAAYLAGLFADFWTIGELGEKWQRERSFRGTLQPERIESLKRQWLKAVQRSKNWAE